MGRSILQDICRLKADWDDPLPEDIIQRGIKWRNDLSSLEGIKIDRCYKPPGFEPVKREIHHFSNASTLRYGNVSYMRMIDASGKVH